MQPVLGYHFTMDTSPIEAETAAQPAREIFTISQLNRMVGELLEAEFPLIWVEGEISNIARPASGHWYFSLKDEAAQVRCAMFRMRNKLLGFKPDNGMQVLIRARVGLYEQRGDFQLIAEHMEEAGDGALRRAFELLKQRLAEEGLFEPHHKLPLPVLPRQIGIITSPSGAAIRDIVTTLKRRFPAIPLLIYPVPVQGATAASDISRMIRIASQRNECDVLILARGGGSLEDLWSFNEESVARAIFDCTIPVVTGIGHEIDVTIADFVADQRAPTPTAAAEMVSPDQYEWEQSFARTNNRLLTLIQNTIQNKNQNLQWLDKRLQQHHPGRRLQQQTQRLDELEQRLRRSIGTFLHHRHTGMNEINARLMRHIPTERISHYKTSCGHLNRRLTSVVNRQLEKHRHQLATLSRALDTVSPLATLARGYAVVRTLPDGKIVRTSKDVDVNSEIETLLGKGRLISNIKKTYDD